MVNTIVRPVSFWSCMFITIEYLTFAFGSNVLIPVAAFAICYDANGIACDVSAADVHVYDLVCLN